MAFDNINWHKLMWFCTVTIIHAQGNETLQSPLKIIKELVPRLPTAPNKQTNIIRKENVGKSKTGGMIPLSHGAISVISNKWCACWRMSQQHTVPSLHGHKNSLRNWWRRLSACCYGNEKSQITLFIYIFPLSSIINQISATTTSPTQRTAL